MAALDFEQLLRMVTSDSSQQQPQQQQSRLNTHPLGGADALASIDSELRRWWEGAPPRGLSPLLLAWAAFVALANMLHPGHTSSPSHHPIRTAWACPRQRQCRVCMRPARGE